MRPACSARRHPVRLERQADVPGDGAPRQERAAVVLEDDRDVGLWAGDAAALHPRLAGRSGQEAGHDPEQGRLATPRGTDDADELALGDGEAQVLENGTGRRPRTENDRDAAGLEDRDRHARAGERTTRRAPAGRSPCPS